MIYSPTYQGEHRQARYDYLKVEFLMYLEFYPKNITLNIDFLFESEQEHYFLYIFHPMFQELRQYADVKEYRVSILSASKPKLRKIRKILKKLVYPYGDISIYKDKSTETRYYIETIIYG